MDVLYFTVLTDLLFPLSLQTNVCLLYEDGAVDLWGLSYFSNKDDKYPEPSYRSPYPTLSSVTYVIC